MLNYSKKRAPENISAVILNSDINFRQGNEIIIQLFYY